MMTLSVILITTFLAVTTPQGAPKGPLGIFENEADIGQGVLPGSVAYNAEKDEYRITGGGTNMWGEKDEFHFLYNRITAGNLQLTSRLEIPASEGGNAHRKGGWMIRESLDADSPYVDAVLHGDGLISLQYREKKGGETKEVKAPTSRTSRLALERIGNRFTLWSEGGDGALREAGSVSLQLPETAFVGLVVCSHDAGRRESVVFTEVKISRDPKKGGQ